MLWRAKGFVILRESRGCPLLPLIFFYFCARSDWMYSMQYRLSFSHTHGAGSLVNADLIFALGQEDAQEISEYANWRRKDWGNGRWVTQLRIFSHLETGRWAQQAVFAKSACTVCIYVLFFCISSFGQELQRTDVDLPISKTAKKKGMYVATTLDAENNITNAAFRVRGLYKTNNSKMDEMLVYMRQGRWFMMHWS